MRVTIIGGGIIGLSSAWYLKSAGFEVEVIDQNDFSNNCSYGNAGFIAPSHIIPLASPGMVAKGIKYFMNPSSPFYIKPTFDIDLIKWAWNFYRSATAEHVEKSMTVIRDINWLSKKLYKELFLENGGFEYNETGLLQIFKTEKGMKAELSTAEKANQIGVEARVLDIDQVIKLTGMSRVDALGAVYYPGDALVYPDKFMNFLKQKLKDANVIFHSNTRVLDFTTNRNRIEKIRTSKGEFSVEYLVLASGAWTRNLVKKIGLNLLLQDGKGYSITLQDINEKPAVPAVLTESKVAVSPYKNALRLGGTLEFSTFSEVKRQKRIKAIIDAVPRYYPSLNVTMPKIETVWYGYRPCSYDGLPYIGASDKFNNLVLATGHSMMGLSMGPATGKLVSEILSGQNLSMDIKPFAINRAG